MGGARRRRGRKKSRTRQHFRRTRPPATLYNRRSDGTRVTMTIDEIRDNFSLLDEWDDRYRYVIELGRTLAPMPEELRTETNKVQGCASQVWLGTSVKPDG